MYKIFFFGIITLIIGFEFYINLTFYEPLLLRNYMNIKQYLYAVITNIAIIAPSHASEGPFFKLPTQFGLDKENRILAEKVSRETNASIKELTAAVSKLKNVEVSLNTGMQEETAKSIQAIINQTMTGTKQTISELDQTLKNRLEELDKITDKTVQVDINFTNTEAAKGLIKTTALNTVGIGSCFVGLGLAYLGIKHALTTQYDTASKGGFSLIISHPYTAGLLSTTAGAGAFFGGLYLIIKGDSIALKL